MADLLGVVTWVFKKLGVIGLPFLDSDDLWHPQKLEFQMAAIQAKQVSICATKKFVFNDEAKAIQESKTVYTDEPEIMQISYSDMLGKNWLANSSVIVEKSLALKIPIC